MTNKPTYNTRVVNMSVGMPAIDSYMNDPLCRAVRRLVDAGVVVVVAAGNNGKDGSGNKLYGRIHSPANEPSAITVGASNTFGTDARLDDRVATFSSRGPTRSFWTDALGVKHYDNLVKPDLVAPGNNLVSAEAKGCLLITSGVARDAVLTTNDLHREMYMSGTSMASPVVAGAAAKLLHAHPSPTPNKVKKLLMYTAQPPPRLHTFRPGAGQ